MLFKKILNIVYIVLIYLISINSYSGNISGNYKCIVSSHDSQTNKIYQSNEDLIIKQRGEVDYQVWFTSPDKQNMYFIGRGLVQANALAIVKDKTDSLYSVIELLAINPDNTLTGTWAKLSNTGLINIVGSENCTKN